MYTKQCQHRIHIAKPSPLGQGSTRDVNDYTSCSLLFCSFWYRNASLLLAFDGGLNDTINTMYAACFDPQLSQQYNVVFIAQSG